MSKIIRTGRLVLAAFGLLVMFAGTSHAQQASTANLAFNDALTTLFSSNRTLVSGIAGRTPAIAYAKVIISNKSNGIRAVDCSLTFPNMSGDVASVTLAPDTFATLSLQVARGTSAADIRAGLSCRVTTGATSDVFAQWSKVTTVFLNGVTAGFGG